MELSDLAIFQAVLQEGGITAAARRLHRVQSNITTRIKQLEDSLGVTLFERDGRGVRPTAAAQVLAGYSERLLALADEARSAVASDTPRGSLRLGAMENTAAVRLPPLLAHFHRHYPQVQLELRTGPTASMISAVLAGELDGALVCGPVSDPRLASQPFCRENLLLISALGARIGPEHGPQTLLAFDHGCAYRQRLERWLQESGCVVGRLVELDSYHAMISCAASGMGIALVPEALLALTPAAGHVARHPLPPHLAQADTVFIRREGTKMPALDAFAAHFDTIQP